MIALQAVTYALGDASGLPPDERAVARDRAAITIRESARALAEAWGATPMPEHALELLQDARDALRVMESLALHWVVEAERWESGRLEEAAASLVDAGFIGDVLAAPTGTTLFRAAVAVEVFPEPGSGDPVGAALSGFDCAGLRRLPGVRPALQVYRQVDQRGVVTRDLLAPLATQLSAGMPLLAPMVVAGVVQGRVTSRPSRLPDDVVLTVVDHIGVDAE